MGQDKVGFEQFRLWLTINKDGTGLSRWLLLEPCVSLSSELEMPTFYQTLAGVTHLEEHVSINYHKFFQRSKQYLKFLSNYYEISEIYSLYSLYSLTKM